MLQPPPHSNDYEYDVFVSYPRGGNVEPWVRWHLLPLLMPALQENLARKMVFIDSQDLDTGVSWPEALEYAHLRSRVLLAVFSRQYFKKAWCLAELESMLARHKLLGLGTPEDPTILVHAIVAQDCEDDRVPPAYAHIQRSHFKSYVWGYPDRGWSQYKEFEDAVMALAERIADTVEKAPHWSPDFPALRPPAGPSDTPTVPRF
jgi:hypothetical protein